MELPFLIPNYKPKEKKPIMDNQIKDKLKSFNRQRNSLIIVAALLIVLFTLTDQLCFPAFVILFCLDIAFFFISQRFSKLFVEAIKEERRTIEILKQQAYTDELTQLLNRNGFEQALTTVWAFCKRYKKPIGFIMADIDCFKNYNDTLGHYEGDNILRQVGEAIKACCKRETDIVSRIGGEEFLIVLPDISDTHIVKVAQEISHSIAELEIEKVGQCSCSPFLSISIGIATGAPTDELLPTDLYKSSDAAMYQAKGSGRNCICFNGTIIYPDK
jgi:diguanylate cyclase (GGDEF)-like protein